MHSYKIIIFPTDTVYGLGCSVYDYKSLKIIYKIKNRDPKKPISVLCFNLEQIQEIALIDNKIKKLALCLWPGPLTIIVFANKKYYSITKEKTIGIRIPNHPLALEILQNKGPFKTTSVNPSGTAPINDYLEIKKKYQNKVDYVYPNDQIISNVSSTVIDTTLSKWKIIREGNISLSKIKEIIN
ncbi:MAG: L-threonylcarbamoyladenylate synthase [Phytoplasma sp.]|uniref:L-threonylcarbamoyladenylate synthase n=1 Tax=Phytoplasma sp. TaxID=2155 RepID=UPI002B4034C6|nr:L-threonylcarbamoyladenylate synthase [Phytoplasma sp.]WRH06596.1 MAG: L-threonylcarbamoyladenylate synthase [Phytoplasma sp.]